MKLLVVAPQPEEAGPLLACADQVWIAGSEPADLPGLRLFQRDDPCPTHWMRSGSVPATRWLRGLLRELAVDLVHVRAWQGFTHDPVLVAARLGIPAVVDLPDHSATCLLGTRRRPEDGTPCGETYGPYACVPCAARVQPVPRGLGTDRAYLAFGERAAALGREIALARARLVPSAEHGEQLVRALGTALGPLLVAPPRGEPGHDAFYRDLYRRVVALGPPPPEEVGERPWFAERMRAASEEAWDQAFEVE